MSTDLRDRTTPPSPTEGPDADEKPKSSLSITQVVGGALAAMTAAALGSRLSVAGTVVGAALASIVAAVAGAVYTSSLRRTSEHVSTVWRTRVRPDGRGGTTTVTERVTQDVVEGEPVTRTETFVAPGWPTEQPSASTSTPAPAGRRRRIGWKPVLVAALLMFAMAVVALTGLELATGRALSGGTGTTVGQVAEGATEPTSKPTAPAKTKSSPSPSATDSAEPSATASPTPSSEATPEPTTTPSLAAPPSATATPSSTPTSPTSSTPRSVAPSAPAATPGS